MIKFCNKSYQIGSKKIFGLTSSLKRHVFQTWAESSLSSYIDCLRTLFIINSKLSCLKPSLSFRIYFCIGISILSFLLYVETFRTRISKSCGDLLCVGLSWAHKSALKYCFVFWIMVIGLSWILQRFLNIFGSFLCSYALSSKIRFFVRRILGVLRLVGNELEADGDRRWV